MTWVFALFWYQSASGYTAIILYEYNYILLFNLIFTAAPPLIIGIFDQDLTEAQILAFPQIYHLGMSQYFFNFKRFLLYMSEAIYQSYISYHFAQLSFADIPNTEGLVADRLILGTVTALNAIIAINCTMVMNIRSWTWISAIVMFFSAISFPAYLPFHSMIVRNLPKGIISALFTDPRLYIEVALCTITCLIPRMMILSWKLFVSPSDIDIIRESMRSLELSFSRHVDIFPDEMQKFTEPAVLDEILLVKSRRRHYLVLRPTDLELNLTVAYQIKLIMSNSVSRVLPSAATHNTRFSEDISRYDEDGHGHIVFMGGPLPDNTESLDHDPMHANIPALPPADGLGDADVP
ncbi:hypothetical protein BSLG_005716 [Batrachochytrium salamandrivorans]|nr:hypothetical protein BSLG_005716 [Batrachochytrium salamandrivorans]